MVGNNPINVIDPFGEAWYNLWTWFDPNPGDNVELANGDWYGPALTKPDGILTPLSGGRENLFSDFKDDVHHLGSEIGKELAVNGAMMLIPEEEALGIVGKWLKKLKPAKSCEKIPKIPGNPFKGKKAAQDAFNHLEKYHGLDPAVASERLHKKALRLFAATGTAWEIRLPTPEVTPSAPSKATPPSPLICITARRARAAICSFRLTAFPQRWR